MVEPIGEADLQAFVDGEIEPLRRFEVADYLANHPAQAAQVMADIRSSAALKILYGEARWHLADGTVGAARKLQHGLHGRRFGFWVARAAGVVALIGFFYFAHLKAGAFEIPDDQTGQPAFVVDAVHAYRTQLLLTHMTSMANMPDYDADEIRAVTEIVVPPLLPGIEVTNIQLVPTHARAGIDAMLKTESPIASHCSRFEPMTTRSSRRPSASPKTRRRFTGSRAAVGMRSRAPMTSSPFCSNSL